MKINKENLFKIFLFIFRSLFFAGICIKYGTIDMFIIALYGAFEWIACYTKDEGFKAYKKKYGYSY